MRDPGKESGGLTKGAYSSLSPNQPRLSQGGDSRLCEGCASSAIDLRAVPGFVWRWTATERVDQGAVALSNGPPQSETSAPLKADVSKTVFVGAENGAADG